MKLNTKMKSEPVFTEEGGKAVKVNNYLALKRSVLASFLWEDNAYQDGVSIAERIAQLIPLVPAEKVADLAIQARNQYKLRHVPLFICLQMAKHDSHKGLVSETLSQVIQRPDELAETLALYWKNGKRPISNQIKRGLASAFGKFDAHALQKYNRDATIKLRDVLFLTHPKPANKLQETTWKKLVNNELPTPVTWETQISASKGENKKAIWEKLLRDENLQGLALLRNLRNMRELGVNEGLIENALEQMSVARILPFRFIVAARYYPGLENVIEQTMFKSVENMPKLSGSTIILNDVSGSMRKPLSDKSEMTRMDAGIGLAILGREVCEKVKVFSFSKKLIEVPNRRGFALRDAIVNSQEHKDTYLGAAINELNEKCDYDRLIVFSDEASCDAVPNPKCRNAYMVNVSNNQHGVGYKGNWTHCDGFSEHILSFIREVEAL